MATTKVSVQISVVIAHPDGVRLRKKEIAEYLRWVLETFGEYTDSDRMGVSRAIVRSVDRGDANER